MLQSMDHEGDQSYSFSIFENFIPRTFIYKYAIKYIAEEGKEGESPTFGLKEEQGYARIFDFNKLAETYFVADRWNSFKIKVKLSSFWQDEES